MFIDFEMNCESEITPKKYVKNKLYIDTMEID